MLFFTSFCFCEEQKSHREAIKNYTQILPVFTSGAPLPGGSFYSQALYIGNPKEILFIAGQLPIDPNTYEVITDPVLGTQQCMNNIGALLANAGMNFSHLSKVLIAVTNIEDTLPICAAYQAYLVEPYPTLSVIQGAALPLGSTVGIEAMAVT